MEKLTDRILQILLEDSSIIVLSKPTLPRVAKLISEEIKDSDLVKDIAIEFAKYRADIVQSSNFRDYIPTHDEMFTDFLANYKRK